MVLLNLQDLKRFSEVISPAAAEASSVSYGTDDRDPILTTEHVTTL